MTVFVLEILSPTNALLLGLDLLYGEDLLLIAPCLEMRYFCHTTTLEVALSGHAVKEPLLDVV